MEAPRGRKSSMAISCSGVVGLWCLAVLLLCMAESVPQVRGTSCNPLSLEDCSSALTEGTSPTSQCCTELQNANIPCLCNTYANSESAADVTAAMALLSKCDLNQYAGEACGRMISLSLSLSLSLSPLYRYADHILLLVIYSLPNSDSMFRTHFGNQLGTHTHICLGLILRFCLRLRFIV
jgi:hypothetical protein